MPGDRGRRDGPWACATARNPALLGSGRGQGDRSARLQAAEIKRAAAALSALKSELAKLEEQLEECSRCGAFLLRLTPPEWLADQAAARASAQQVP
jgi:hypothetical protein